MTRSRFSNPIAEGADPWVIFHEGRYYWCLSAAGKGVFVFSSDRLNSLGVRHLVWSAPASGPFSDQVWAPELHRIDGVWYIYTTASDGNNANHRLIVLECREAIPTGEFQFKAQLYTGDCMQLGRENRWAIDATPLFWQGKLYLVWSGWRADWDEQWLYIAPMSDPWTISGNRVCVCENNDYLWERVDEAMTGRGLNEAPQVLQRAGRTFVVFSASGSWQPSYKLGLLELVGSDPLSPKSWRKHPEPSFVSSEQTWGIGHGSFTTSPDGTEDWLVYHAKETRGHDWLRSIFAQQFAFTADGLPLFGHPVARGEQIPLPAGTRIKTSGGDYRSDFSSGWSEWDYYGHQDLVASTPKGLRLGEFGESLAVYRTGEKLILRDRLWLNARMELHFTAGTVSTGVGVLFRASDIRLGYEGQSGFEVRVRDGEISLHHWTDGSAVLLCSERIHNANPDCETKLCVQSEGTSLTSHCNGVAVLRFDGLAPTAGAVGIRLSEGKTLLRAFILHSPEDTLKPRQTL